MNTQAVDYLGYTPHEIMFGFKPVIPAIAQLGIMRNDNKWCRDDNFCSNTPTHRHLPAQPQNKFWNKFEHVKIH